MEEENNGLTIRDCLKMILNRKWLALAIAVAITVAGTFALYYGYGRRSSYVANFSIMLPVSERSVMKYPDNTVFNYRDLVSRRNLYEIKGMDGSFSDIDAEGLYSGGLSISLFEEEEPSAEYKFEIKVKAKYFKSKEQAQDFIKCIVGTPVRYLQSLVADKSMFLAQYDGTEYYEEKTDFLLKRADDLKEISGMISSAGNALGTACRTLETKLDAFKRDLDSTILYMRGDITENGESADIENKGRQMIVHNASEVKNHYSQAIKTLQSELDTERRELTLLSAGAVTERGSAVSRGGAQGVFFSFSNMNSNQNDIVSSRIAELAKQIAEHERLINIYTRYTESKTQLIENAAFKATLDGYKNRLEECAQSFADEIGASSDGSVVVYDGMLSEDGTISIVSSILVSLVAGIVIAVLIAFMLGYIKYKKNGGGRASGKEKEEETLKAADGSQPDSGTENGE